ncbi:hypothetical protein I3842_06G031300 [Carya illinoinensis]|uniref:Uncharacterized protein n=1 Tax=Carya illinoinensis TaxID=32201 RepID=A0A922ENZ0_CARIL|nr:hypothetical protein I3842_06G031300 [Carya illinoinensis]
MFNGVIRYFKTKSSKHVLSNICIWLSLSMGNGTEHPSTLTPCSSTTSKIVGSEDNRPDGGETEASCTIR